MLKFLKWVGIALGVIVVAIGVFILVNNESRPEGKECSEADDLARKMLTAINYEAWDTTRFVQWDFGGRHQFFWDKQQHNVEVVWNDYRVLLHTKSLTGKAWKNEVPQTGKKQEKLIQKAWALFSNDSFWLNAPAKAFDPGTVRKLVTLENNEQALLVEYTSGGVTPGDSYLWIFDEQGLPKRWKMWVKIIPIGGLAASWENWQTLSTGAKVATTHQMGFYTLELTDIKAGQNLEVLGRTDDPFLDF